MWALSGNVGIRSLSPSPSPSPPPSPQDVVCSVLLRLRVNMAVAPQLFSILLRHGDSGETHWLQPGFPLTQQLLALTSHKPLDQWRLVDHVMSHDLSTISHT